MTLSGLVRGFVFVPLRERLLKLISLPRLVEAAKSIYAVSRVLKKGCAVCNYEKDIVIYDRLNTLTRGWFGKLLGEPRRPSGLECMPHLFHQLPRPSSQVDGHTAIYGDCCADPEVLGYTARRLTGEANDGDIDRAD